MDRQLVEVKGLSKSYGRNKEIFNDLNLSLASGKIIGLLGPNGSGKTTLIKLIAGLLSPDAGEIIIDGQPVGPATKGLISYLPERTYFNEDMRVKDIIKIFRDFYTDFEEERSIEMMDSLGIDKNSIFKKLSKGTREKVQLIMVMSRRARLYLLDEPIAGVDPAARDYILRTILTNYDENATLLISTHLIQDIENVLDDVIFIRNGEILRHTPADDLRCQMGKSIDEIFREEFRC